MAFWNQAAVLLATTLLAVFPALVAAGQQDRELLASSPKSHAMVAALPTGHLPNSSSGGMLDMGARMVDAFASSFSMILVSEIGDETFIIAALLAMRHSRVVVYAGALGALFLMTVLSTALGIVVPNLISRTATIHAATALYIFFGCRLLYIAWYADPGITAGKELEEKEAEMEHGEMGSRPRPRYLKALAQFASPVFLEAFVLTFLAEWGDRSQIATISLAAVKNPVGVTVGATLGHAVCTAGAVLGGRMIAARISQRTVAVAGGLLFLAFAAHNAFFGEV